MSRVTVTTRVVNVMCHDPFSAENSYPFAVYVAPRGVEDEEAVELAETAAGKEYLARQTSDAGVPAQLTMDNFTAITGVWFEGAVMRSQDLVPVDEEARLSDIEYVASEISVYAARLHEANNADDHYDAKVDLERALKAFDGLLAS